MAGARADRKSLQLCRQVSQTLDEVFAECRDDALRSLRVVAVEPAPDAGRLLVTVTPDVGYLPGGPNPAAIMDHLARASGHLRAEVAHAITRKRTPTLFYRLASPTVEGETPDPARSSEESRTITRTDEGL
jgi:ribosome-binding factor A